MPITNRVEATNGIRYVYDTQVQMVMNECCTCGVMFALPAVLDRTLRRDGDGFYCPHGHSLTYGESEADRLKRQLANAREEARIERAATEVERQLHAASRAELTKARKRAAAALCPVDGCHRQIVQMRRHLAAKHPDYHPAP